MAKASKSRRRAPRGTESALRDAFARTKRFTGTVLETNNPGDETERRLQAAAEKLRRVAK